MDGHERSVIIRCRACRTLNRVPSGRVRERARCGRCKRQLFIPATPVQGTSGNFQEEVLDWHGTVLVEFWTPHCGACSLLAPVLAELARERVGSLKIVTIDAEQEQSLARRFQVLSVPTLILYRNGRRLNETRGALSKSQLASWIDSR
jgi:thioredoxin 2